MYIREPDGEPPTFQPQGANMQDDPRANFTFEDVKKQLRESNLTNLWGLTQSIHPYVLRECADEMEIPLYDIYRKSMEKGVVPEDWGLVRVVLIFKKEL